MAIAKDHSQQFNALPTLSLVVLAARMLDQCPLARRSHCSLKAMMSTFRLAVQSQRDQVLLTLRSMCNRSL